METFGVRLLESAHKMNPMGVSNGAAGARDTVKFVWAYWGQALMSCLKLFSEILEGCKFSSAFMIASRVAPLYSINMLKNIMGQSFL